MAETAGYEGKIYKRVGYLTGVKAAFSYSSASIPLITMVGIASAGFASSDTILIAGAASSTNNGNFTLHSASAVSGSTLRLIAADTLSSSSGSSIVTVDAQPGTALAGFYNWTINYTADVHEVTDFANTEKAYVVGPTTWTGTATKRYQTSSSMGSSVGSSALYVRFFLRYRATPTAGNPTTYLHGSAYVTGMDTTTPVDGVIEQTLNFQGTGALTLTKKATTWNTGA